MALKYKNIIFDWSGVINDNQITTFKVINKIFEHFGISIISHEEFQQEWEQPFMVFYNKYLPNLSLEEEIPIYKKIYQKIIKDNPPKPFPGIVEVINKCNKGKELFLVSSDYKDYLIKEIEDFGFKNVFNEVIAGVHDKEESLCDLVSRNKFELDQTIFIGDTTHEIDVGQKVEIKTAGVTWGIHSEERLSIAKPDHIVHNLDELKNIILN